MSIETTDALFSLATQLLHQAHRLLTVGKTDEALTQLARAAGYTEGIAEIVAAHPAAYAPADRQICRVIPNQRGGYSLAVPDPDAPTGWRHIGNGPAEAMIDLALLNGFAIEPLATHLANPSAPRVTAYIPLTKETT